MIRNRPVSFRLMVLSAAAATLVLMASSSTAADCGCEIPCDACSMDLSGCDGGCCDSRHTGCLSHGMHKFKDRLHKLFSKKWCNWSLCGRKDSCCDDACDAALMQDLMWPAARSMHESGQPHADHVLPAPQAMQPIPMPGAESMGSESRTMSPPVRSGEPRRDEHLFDSLQDPFADDHEPVEVPRDVRRSSHEGVVLQPVPRQSFSRTHETSSRRVKSVR
jgi:hypothetical protein